ncbi:hypothetical protein [Photobacterium damselae]|uniref:hypothetical protein n=2 Tax=Photobacterium damselae TaxID=38293 RepID=UPI00083A3796|nr:hypothetical protein [Photobacterium damselae]ODA26025.1 hypothetical protein A0J46_01245 [Photobacterium damselae subsp. damselae]TLS69481.1 hypothetical protein FD718_12370 [Photobacterium damselae subsp. damselae]TLS75486.1 hypothetical protein FD721_16035 [Photobacterium damselae subsp. damselae]TLS84964.1 hypothetical protein FD720_16635 [Photobacterium damselae subsp. damselae]
MKGLQFQRLVLLSDSKRLANQFTFPKRLNLVTGSDNSIGKSTLVKNLFWAIGCEPLFDEEWKSNDVKAILYFKVNQQEYIVSRYTDGIYFGRKGTVLAKYSKVTGQFAEDFAEEVGFDLMLANRNNGLDCPPPAFYFLPFYIDQKKSWDEPWNGFEGLGQYSNFKKTLIKYFCGYLSSEHFELEEDVFAQKAIEQEANQQVSRITDAMSVLDEVVPEQTIAFTQAELESIQQEIEKELTAFSAHQSKLFEQQSSLANEIHDLEQQHLIASTSARELDEDYIFAVENVPSDSLECPLCGVEHDNSLLSRAGLLADKEGLEQQVSSIKIALEDKYRQRTELTEELNFVTSEIERINEKYLKEDTPEEESNEQQAFEQALYVISQKKVNSNVVQKKESYLLQSQHAKEKQKDIKKEQRKLVKKKDKDELNELFMGNLVESINALSATGINLNGVNAPMDYKKILGGGAAEGTRGTLAYQLAILRQINHANHCQLAPFVIDTPNQQEQAKHRYEQVMDVVTENIPNGYQVILCAMDNDALSSYKQGAHIIELGGNRLLQREPYVQLRAEYEKVILSNS